MDIAPPKANHASVKDFVLNPGPSARNDFQTAAQAPNAALHNLLMFTTTLGLCSIGLLPFFGFGGALRVDDAKRNLVVAIVRAESNGCTDAKNDRSTAAGPGQFIESTWLRLIRKYRPDLADRTRSELLAMRHDPEISLEMTRRLADENAQLLRRRGHLVTPGALYLSHFAGSGGAAAVLSAPDSADAATTIASADASGFITRDVLVTSNPFLDAFTVADLKSWADRKMAKRVKSKLLRKCRS